MTSDLLGAGPPRPLAGARAVLTGGRWVMEGRGRGVLDDRMFPEGGCRPLQLAPHHLSRESPGLLKQGGTQGGQLKNLR